MNENATPVEISAEIASLDSRLGDALSTVDKAVKNKKGIEIHGRLEWVKEQVDALEAAGDAEAKRLADELLPVVRKLLKGVFGIESTDEL